MRTTPSFWHGIRLVAASALMLCLAPGCKPKIQPSGPPKSASVKTNALAAATNQLSNQYTSVFLDLMPPKGRDPFFPNSHRRDPAAPPAAAPEKPPPSSEVMLKGVVGAASHRLAVIGGSRGSAMPMEVGDSATIHVTGGQVRVTCIEVGEDYAIIQVEGETQPKRLELPKKGF